ncbi:peritrophin-44 isoform X2 [Musca domestica]|uniref:Peritrophin-44 isoform X1 n=1 Tax=Musca domestica TaxID=7370 RepID=A0A1I8MZ51_MUSDO|nr:peritrophin-44 isoform X2 [Musca domestica]
MQDFKMTSGLCLALLGLVALQMQCASAGYSMAETCLYYGEGYIADPDQCNGWGYCKGGELIAQGTCPGTYLYNQKTAQCDFPENVKCASKLESTCSVVTSPIYLADPDDCTKACYCNNGTYSCTTCPQYQVFDPTKRACVYSNQYNCPANSICRLVPDGKWVADPLKCGNYLACLDGSGTSKECPDNLFFNQFKNMCAIESICPTETEPPSTASVGPGVEKPLPDSKTACAENPNDKTDTTSKFYVEDGKSCMGYYYCEKAGETGIWGKCPLGTHFNQADQNCVTPYTVDCKYDRCGNINQTYVSVLGCADYYYCINQTKQVGMGGNCANNNPNYPYFSEAQGACVDVDPKFAICSAPAPSPVGN